MPNAMGADVLLAQGWRFGRRFGCITPNQRMDSKSSDRLSATIQKRWFNFFSSRDEGLKNICRELSKRAIAGFISLAGYFYSRRSTELQVAHFRLCRLVCACTCV